MSEIAEILEARERLRAGGAADSEKINIAEEALGLKFANDYTEYLKAFGFASYKGHELTGLCNSARLNVTDVTVEARELYDLASDMYVIEETGYEGILILQDTKGNIYHIEPGSKPEKIFSSLADYIQNERI